MSEYIKREDAYKYLDEQLVEVFTGETFLDALKQIIAKLPSADAVEVVRCKDCKGYTPADETYGTCYAYKGVYGKIKPTDYCSYGERANDEIDS